MEVLPFRGSLSLGHTDTPGRLLKFIIRVKYLVKLHKKSQLVFERIKTRLDRVQNVSLTSDFGSPGWSQRLESFLCIEFPEHKTPIGTHPYPSETLTFWTYITPIFLVTPNSIQDGKRGDPKLETRSNYYPEDLIDLLERTHTDDDNHLCKLFGLFPVPTESPGTFWLFLRHR